jgi:hypothetical protein
MYENLPKNYWFWESHEITDALKKLKSCAPENKEIKNIRRRVEAMQILFWQTLSDDGPGPIAGHWLTVKPLAQIHISIDFTHLSMTRSSTR